jgi:hypothetical protein
MNGCRVYPDKEGTMVFAPGDYGLDRGVWYGRIPTEFGNFHLGSFEKHQVVEHEDGTITVSPSILHTEPDDLGGKQWHGFLERGVWRRC